MQFKRSLNFMKNFGLDALALVVCVTGASAADMAARGASPVLNRSRRGLASLIGATFGVKQSNANWTTTSLDNPFAPPGAFVIDGSSPTKYRSSAGRIGGLLGYDVQIGSQWVAGLEFDAAYSDEEKTSAGIPGCAIACIFGTPGPSADSSSIKAAVGCERKGTAWLSCDAKRLDLRHGRYRVAEHDGFCDLSERPCGRGLPRACGQSVLNRHQQFGFGPAGPSAAVSMRAFTATGCCAASIGTRTSAPGGMRLPWAPADRRRQRRWARNSRSIRRSDWSAWSTNSATWSSRGIDRPATD